VLQVGTLDLTNGWTPRAGRTSTVRRAASSGRLLPWRVRRTSQSGYFLGLEKIGGDPGNDAAGNDALAVRAQVVADAGDDVALACR